MERGQAAAKGCNRLVFSRWPMRAEGLREEEAAFKFASVRTRRFFYREQFNSCEIRGFFMIPKRAKEPPLLHLALLRAIQPIKLRIACLGGIWTARTFAWSRTPPIHHARRCSRKAWVNFQKEKKERLKKGTNSTFLQP